MSREFLIPMLIQFLIIFAFCAGISYIAVKGLEKAGIAYGRWRVRRSLQRFFDNKRAPWNQGGRP